MEKYYSMTELLQLVPYKRQHIYQMIDEGRFPRLTKLGIRRVGVAESQLKIWFNWRKKLDELIVEGIARDMRAAERLLPSPFRTGPQTLSAAEAKRVHPHSGKDA